MTIPYVIFPALAGLGFFWMLVGAPISYWLLKKRSWEHRRGLKEELQLEYDLKMMEIGMVGLVVIILIMLTLGIVEEGL